MPNVLAKKIGTASVSRSPIADVEQLGDQFVRGVESALRPLLKCSISGMVLDTEVTKLSAIAEGIPVPALLGVLTFQGATNAALINMSADLVYHIIDLRLGADSGVCPIPTTRSFTAIDLRLCRPVLELVATSFEQAVERAAGGPLDSAITLSDIKQNITSVSIAPDNADVLQISAALDIGTAARGGDFELIVPLSVLDVIRSSVRATGTADVFAANDIWRTRMRRAAKEAEVPLTAVLHRGRLAASFIQGMKAGDVIPIASDAPQSVSLTLNPGDPREAVFATAKLGGFEGKKVLKLASDPDPSFVSHLRDVTDGSA